MKLSKKQLKKEKKIASKKIEACNICVDFINNTFWFKKKTETIEDLINSIHAISNVDSNISGYFAVNHTILTIKVNELKNGELERIIKFKNNNENIYIKLDYE